MQNLYCVSLLPKRYFVLQLCVTESLETRGRCTLNLCPKPVSVNILESGEASDEMLKDLIMQSLYLLLIF